MNLMIGYEIENGWGAAFAQEPCPPVGNDVLLDESDSGQQAKGGTFEPSSSSGTQSQAARLERNPLESQLLGAGETA